MTSQQTGLLLIQLTVSIGVLLILAWYLLRASESNLKYKLFAVRDQFLYLAATGVINENSMVFKVFYRAMNTYITEIESVTIVSFMRASVAVKTQLEKENKERLIESLRRSDPQVQATIDHFFQTVMDALRYNSPMLSLILAVARHCATLFSLLRKLPRVPVKIYETYRYYESLHGNMQSEKEWVQIVA
jgi:uncharacterized alpha/beta hydrolase family protein